LAVSWRSSFRTVNEVYCECDPAVAVSRFLARDRHPGHGDAQKSRDGLIEQFEVLARLGPLGLGRTITVNTEAPVDIAALVAGLAL